MGVGLCPLHEISKVSHLLPERCARALAAFLSRVSRSSLDCCLAA